MIIIVEVHFPVLVQGSLNAFLEDERIRRSVQPPAVGTIEGDTSGQDGLKSICPF